MKSNVHSAVFIAALFLLLPILFINCQSAQKAPGPGAAVLQPEGGTSGEQGDAPSAARDAGGPVEPAEGAAISSRLDEPIPVDPDVTIGILENGLTYYIRENGKPEDTAVLRLVVDVGSVIEEDEERGYAHFVEHMAFEGTERFAKSDIVDYLETIGMRYGPEVNASTSFDETVYMLEVPTADGDAVRKAFMILSEWAHAILFEEDQVARERGVIVEEWRERSGVGMRIVERHYPILFEGSRYADRLPIGDLAVIERATADSLKRFYENWYRPELMAVVAVGDFDAAKIEGYVEDAFGIIPKSEPPIERPRSPVPDRDGTRYSLVTDPEAKDSRVSVYRLQDVVPQRTHRDYRDAIVRYLYTGMLNSRLEELAKSADPPFIRASTGRGLIVRTKEVTVLNATVREGGIERGLESILLEVKRAGEYGFTETELQREKRNLLRWMEQYYRERANNPSHAYAGEYIRNFLEDENIPGIAYEYELFSGFIPNVTLQEVGGLAQTWLDESNLVVLVSGPQGRGGAETGSTPTAIPDEDALNLVFKRVGNTQVVAYTDLVREGALLAVPPSPGRIVMTSEIEEIGVSVWVLSNGATVYLKPTDFKEDEILFEALSPGGHSLVEDRDYIAAITAPTAVRDGGVGDFNRTELEKKLAGRVVELTPWISEIHEGLSGSTSKEDLETFLTLVHLIFTAPRKDADAFAAYRERLHARFENRRSDPEEVFWDTVRSTMQQNHFRARPLTVDVLDEMDLNVSYRIFNDRFFDAGDFEFVLVGSFELDAVEPLVLTYLGGLPAEGRRESWRDLGIDPPGGIVQKSVRMGIEPRSQVTIAFSDALQWSRESAFDLKAMADILDMRLREKVREEQSGTYGIWVYAETQKYPDGEYTVYIGFGCDPERVDELTETVFEAVDWMRKDEIDDLYLVKEREILKRGLEQSRRENGYWLKGIATALRRGEDPAELAETEALIDRLDRNTVRRIALQTLTPDRYVRVVLYPE